MYGIPGSLKLNKDQFDSLLKYITHKSGLKDVSELIDHNFIKGLKPLHSLAVNVNEILEKEMGECSGNQVQKAGHTSVTFDFKGLRRRKRSVLKTAKDYERYQREKVFIYAFDLNAIEHPFMAPLAMGSNFEPYESDAIKGARNLIKEVLGGTGKDSIQIFPRGHKPAFQGSFLKHNTEGFLNIQNTRHKAGITEQNLKNGVLQVSTADAHKIGLPKGNDYCLVPDGHYLSYELRSSVHFLNHKKLLSVPILVWNKRETRSKVILHLTTRSSVERLIASIMVQIRKMHVPTSIRNISVIMHPLNEYGWVDPKTDPSESDKKGPLNVRFELKYVMFPSMEEVNKAIPMLPADTTCASEDYSNQYWRNADDVADEEDVPIPQARNDFDGFNVFDEAESHPADMQIE